MQLVFNELSANGMYENSYSANEGMKRLVEHIKRLVYEPDDQLVMPQNYRMLVLSKRDNYTIDAWCSNINKNIERDIRLNWCRWVDKAPYLEEIQQDLNVDYYYHGLRSLGLGKAYEIATYAISLDCDNQFCISPLVFEKHILNNEQEISIDTISVLNVYSDEQIEYIKQIAENAELRNAGSGEDLLSYISIGLKHLILTNDAKNALIAMNGKERYFKDVRKHLALLNQAMKEYQPGSTFNPTMYGIKWSPESETTLNLYSADRTIRCPDGIKRVFSNHTKINTDAWRIYFEADLEKRMVIIGCITKHLRTASGN